MQLVHKIAEITQFIAEKNTAMDTTYALVPLGANLAPGDVVAARHGARLCDVVVGCVLGGVLGGVLDDGAQKILEAAGVKLLYMPGMHPPAKHVSVIDSVRDTDYTLLLQSILAVMPSVVAVADENVPMLAALRALEGTFEGLFTLLVPEMPQHLQDEAHQNLMQTLMLAQTLVDQGERVVRTLHQQLVAGLHTAGFTEVRELALFDGETLREVTERLPRNSFLFAEVVQGGVLLRQSVRLRIH